MKYKDRPRNSAELRKEGIESCGCRSDPFPCRFLEDTRQHLNEISRLERSLFRETGYDQHGVEEHKTDSVRELEPIFESADTEKEGDGEDGMFHRAFLVKDDEPLLSSLLSDENTPRGRGAGRGSASFPIRFAFRELLRVIVIIVFAGFPAVAERRNCHYIVPARQRNGWTYVDGEFYADHRPALTFLSRNMDTSMSYMEL